MNFAIRVDASTQMGNGHLMRCLTLADRLREQGGRCRFVSRHMPEHLQGLLDSRGYEFIRLQSAPAHFTEGGVPHAAWLGTTQAVDLRDTTQALSDAQWDWVVVDHYALDEAWETGVRDVTANIFVIDDLADRPHDCDMLLDQNIYTDMSTRYVGKVPQDCQLLLGPGYALLRPEFLQYRALVSPRDGIVRRILVLMGGVDAENITEKAIHAITLLRDRSFEVDIVVGKNHPARDDINRLCTQYGFKCHIEITNVAQLMSRADLAIGASGSASWERCCLGLPTICLTQAHNQIAIADGLHATGSIVNLGDGIAISVNDFSRGLLTVIDNRDQLLRISAAASELVDGYGAMRVCEKLTGIP